MRHFVLYSSGAAPKSTLARVRLAAVVAAGACAALVACVDLRSSAQADAAGYVAVSTEVDLGDARLHLEVRGERATAPMLVWIHGGPGGAERPLFRIFNGDLEHHFLVAYYDQRGAGLSFDPDASVARLTTLQHVADLDRVIENLRLRYHRRRVLLVGHSWGATLGLLYAQAHPEKVLGIVGVAPAIAFGEQARREYAYDFSEATRRGDRRSLDQLAAIGPPPYAEAAPLLRLQRVTERYGGVAFQPQNRAALVVGALMRRIVTPWEIVRIVQGNQRSLEVMHPQLLALDLRRELQSIDVPVFFFLGRHDHHADAELAAEYLASLQAPMKATVWFERSAHDIPFDEPEAFNRQVMRAFARLDDGR